jgi:hypothetical protein
MIEMKAVDDALPPEELSQDEPTKALSGVPLHS